MEHDHVQDTPEQDARLARSRTCDKEEWAVEMLDGLTLAVVRREAHAGKEGLDHFQNPIGRRSVLRLERMALLQEWVRRTSYRGWQPPLGLVEEGRIRDGAKHRGLGTEQLI